MTTPDTAAVRAWAKDNGMTVADRGRLPADLHAAYRAANGGSAKPAPAGAAAKPTAEKKAPKPSAAKAGGRASAKPSAGTSPGRKAAGTKSTTASSRKPRATSADAPARDEEALALVEVEAAEYVTPEVDIEAPSAEPTPSPESSAESARLIALEVQLSALAGRVAALEQAHAAPPAKQSRFRRRG